VQSLLTADFTFLDGRLAAHYGLPAPGAERVTVAGTARGGLLTQGSFLVTTSHSRRTSPVKRGQWVLTQLLCTPPPPPPNMVEGLEEPKPGEPKTLRDELERHRTSPECAACHRLFDPVGFGLENFDAIGRYRDRDNGQPVDASGEIEGTAFTNARELSAILARDPRLLTCAAQNLLTYAVGRGFESDDGQAYVKAVAELARSKGGTLRSLVEAVVTSEAFVTRRGGNE
jgi:hypothetical protein